MPDLIKSCEQSENDADASTHSTDPVGTISNITSPVYRVCLIGVHVVLDCGKFITVSQCGSLRASQSQSV